MCLNGGDCTFDVGLLGRLVRLIDVDLCSDCAFVPFDVPLRMGTIVERLSSECRSVLDQEPNVMMV